MGERILKMEFVMDDGSKKTLRLRDVKEDVQDADIAAVMDLIVEKNIFEFKGAFIESKSEAVIEETTTDEIEIGA